MQWLIWSCLLAVQPHLLGIDVPEPQYSAYDAVRWAADDIAASASVSLHPNVRYLSFANLTRAQRAKAYQTLCFLMNSLSRERSIRLPLVLPASDGVVIRVDLSFYGITPSAWDKLVTEGGGPADRKIPEPYHYIPATKDVVESVKGADGYLRKVTKKTPVALPAPWVVSPDKGKSMTELVARLQTQTPIVRGDWFIAFAAWGQAYYDLMGIGAKEDDLIKLAFADPELVKKARTQVKAVVVGHNRIVAMNTRALLRFPTVGGVTGGYYWFSQDSFKSIDENNAVNFLLGNKFDAKEVIFTLPNGGQGYGLTDAAGNILPVADVRAALDSLTLFQDKQVHNAVSCMACHVRGLREVDDEVRKLSRGWIDLRVPDKKQARQVEDLYFATDVSALVRHDQGLYAAFIASTSGLQPDVNAAQFERLRWDYLEKPITLETVAMEVGKTPAMILEKLSRARSVDFTITGLLADPPRPIRRDQYERITFQQIMTIMDAK